MNSYNIDDATFRAARGTRVSPIATGGGIDNLWRRLPDGREAVITDATSEGLTAGPGDPCNVIIFWDKEWSSVACEIAFPTVREAIAYVNNLNS